METKPYALEHTITVKFWISNEVLYISYSTTKYVIKSGQYPKLKHIAQTQIKTIKYKKGFIYEKAKEIIEGSEKILYSSEWLLEMKQISREEAIEIATNNTF